MALSSVSPLYISKSPNHLQSPSKPFTVVCRIELQRGNYCRVLNLLKLCFEKREANAESKKWQRLVSTALAAAVVTLSPVMPAVADLNKYEAETRGEFGIGSAAQFGSADLRKAVHVNENFRRANFTSADMRESDFSGSTFNGAYLEKAVAYKANFTGADLSDTLMDRMVLNEANLTNAVLARTVLTRSDLGGAVIEGADFSDAVIDLPQKQSRNYG
ncbi:thylakoid lumenal protein TL20.3, chloroplastic isoform X5 [Vitis vinifera]|uniref:thylakoid lumenal protein TL20.3, chloroplastic isoform X5 n=1 Tax=Vitis vinifera TaxID=29760 RepID=UPI00288342B4|nr:thylakoid lumenal protein TL20.3, chloroplastic isoform X5 [Vitis vinifera]